MRKRFFIKNSIQCLLLLLLLGSTVSWAQKTLTWKSASSTAWETASNWYDEGAGSASTTAPTSSDVVVINSSRGASVQPSVTQSGQACKSLTVGNGFTLTISGSSGSLTVGDGVAGNYDIRIQSGGEIDNVSTASSGNPLSLSNTSNDVFRIDNGGKYLNNTGRPFATPFPASACSFDSTSTVEFGQSAETAVAFSGYTYGNLTLSATSSKTYTASGSSVAYVNGTLTLSSSNVTFSPGMTATARVNSLVVTSGTFSPSASSAWTLQCTGSITNNGTITLPSSNLSIVFDGSTTVSGSGLVTFNNGFTVNAGKTLANSQLGNILGSSKTATINGTFQINEGSWTGSNGTFTYNSSTGTLIFNNTSANYGPIDNSHLYWPSTNGPPNVTIKGAGGINLSVARTISTNFQTSSQANGAANLTLNGTAQINAGGYFTGTPTYGSNSTLVYNTGGSYTVFNEWGTGSSVGSGVPKNVTVQTNTILTLPTTDRYCPGNLTISGGALALNATSGDLYVGGNWSNSGTFTANNRAVFFNGASAQSLTGATTFDYMFVSGSSLSLSSDITVNKNLTINSGKTLSCGSSTISIGSGSGITNNGTFTAGTGTVKFLGSGSVSGTTTFNNIILTGSGGVTLGATSTVSGTLEVQGNYINSGQAPTYAANSTLKYNNGGSYNANEEWYANTTSGSGVPYNVTIASGTSFSFNTAAYARTASGTVTIGGTFTLSSATGGDLFVKGNWVNNGTFSGNTRAVQFNGSTNQSIGGSSSTAFDYLTINNSTGVTLSTNASVNNTLTLMTGNITTGTNKITIGSSGSISRTSGYINGNLEFTINGNGTFTYPIGTSTAYAPVSTTLSGVTGTGTLKASTTNGDHPNIASSIIDPSKSVNRYWTMTQSGFSFTGHTTTFNWVAGDVDAGADTSSFSVRRYTNSAWAVPASVSNRRATSIQVANETSFGDFIAGNILCPTITQSPNSLPGGVLNASYSQTISASGGTSPYTFAVTNGSLPPGLSLSSGGLLSGIPTQKGTYIFTITATDANPCSGNKIDTVTINCPVITVSAMSGSTGTTGVFFSQTIAASGGTAPYTYSLAGGTLPTGLSLSNGGVISGVPTVFGTYIVSVTASDTALCTGSFSDTLVMSCPTITLSPDSLPYGDYGLPFSRSIVASGGTSPYQYSVTGGSLPNGLTLTTGGLLSGTPTVKGTFNFVVTATDSNGCSGTKNYSMIIRCPNISISPSTLPNGIIDSLYSLQLSASGGKTPYTYAVTGGSLPGGYSLSGSGVLSGTSASLGSYSFTVTATDSNGCTGTKTYSFDVTCPTFMISPASLPTGLLDSSYSQTLIASGGKAPYSFSLTGGSFPAGISLSSAGHISGISYTAGVFPLSITVTDSTGCSNVIHDTLWINCSPITISPLVSRATTVGVAYADTLQSLGGKQPYVFVLTSGSFPTGITLSSNGIISGVPLTSGAYHFAVLVTDSSGCTGTLTDSLLSTCLTITVSPATLPGGIVGTSYSQTFTANGGKSPYTFSISNGVLPESLSLSSGGVLSGTPASRGTFIFTVTATDSFGCTGNRKDTLVIDVNHYTITSSAGSHGTISPLGTTTVESGATQAFTITPNIGYHVDSLVVDGIKVDSTVSYTFTTITANHTIYVSFAINTYTITVTQSSNGTISPGTSTVNYGSSITFTISPSIGFHVDSLIVDGNKVDSTTSYTFTNVAMNHTIRAKYSAASYTITPSAGSHGTISPSSQVVVPNGGSQRFIFTPATGYQVDSVIVDGNKVDSTSGYVFQNVSMSHTIRVTFKLGTYIATINVNAKWNLVSVPVVKLDYQKSVIFPSAVSTAYAYDAGYVGKSTLALGAGYWLKFATAGPVSVSGAIFTVDTISVKAGWNIIGALSVPIAVNKIVSIPPAMITSNFFGYKDGYIPTDTLKPGAGYWIKVQSDSKLILDASLGLAAQGRIQPLLQSLPPSPPSDGAMSLGGEIPVAYLLEQNYPNPFNPVTVIQYAIPEQSVVTLKVFNLLGVEVATLIRSDVMEGSNYQVEFDGSNLPSGVYFYRLEATSTIDHSRHFVETKRLLLMK